MSDSEGSESTDSSKPSTPPINSGKEEEEDEVSASEPEQSDSESEHEVVDTQAKGKSGKSNEEEDSYSANDSDNETNDEGDDSDEQSGRRSLEVSRPSGNGNSKMEMTSNAIKRKSLRLAPGSTSGANTGTVAPSSPKGKSKTQLTNTTSTSSTSSSSSSSLAPSASSSSAAATPRSDTDPDKKHYVAGPHDTVLFCKWLKLKDSKERFSDRLIVLTRYRFAMIRKGKFGKKKVVYDGHYFDLQLVSSFVNDQLEIKFKDFSAEISCGGLADEMIDIIRRSFQLNAVGFPPEILPKIKTFPEDRLKPLPPIDYGADGGFLNIYRAWCNYHMTPVSQGFVNYIENLMSGNSLEKVKESSRELSLNECSGIEPKTQHSLDLLPVGFALKFNTHFHTLTLANVPRKEAVAMFAHAMYTNVTLRRITLSGLEAEPETFSALGESFRANPDNGVSELNLSHNLMRDVGAFNIAAALEEKKFGLTKLDLSYCHMSTKGVSAIMKALDANHHTSLTITHFNMSGNQFGPSGTMALANWLSNMKQGEKNLSHLTHLFLADSQIDLETALQSLKTSIMNNLLLLDLSQNKIEKQSIPALTDFLAEVPNLTEINLSRCDLSPEVVEAVLSALNKNDLLDDASLTVRMSHNELGVSGSKAIAKVVRYAKKINLLDIKSNALRKEGTLQVIKAVEQNPSILGLDISENLRSKHTEVIKTLSELFGNDHSNLATLIIANNALGKDIVGMYNNLATNKKLKTLDISGNQIGDKGVIGLAECITKNSSLTCIRCDENSVTLGGWQTFAAALRNNKTLLEFVPPNRDIAKVISSARDKEKAALREKINQVMSQIQQITTDNAASTVVVTQHTM